MTVGRIHLEDEDEQEIIEGIVPRRIVLFGILLPLGIGAALLVILYLTLEWSAFKAMSGFMLAYLFPPMGKESVIPLAVAWGLDWRLVAFTIATIDMLLALFMVWNFDLAKKIPILGRWIIRFEVSGGDLLERKEWIRELALIGVILFVVIPFEGSGGLAASILGRVIGMNRYKVLGAVAVGAYGGCLLIAMFSNQFLSLFTLPVTSILTIAAAVIIVLAFFKIYKHAKKKRGSRNSS